MKFVLLAFSNYLKYLEEITNMCEQMGRLCPQYERFSKLFPTHIELQDSICEFYAIVVDFFREALLFLYSSAFKQFAIATFRPFSDKFSDTIRLLGLVSETVEREITYSSQQEEHIERINNASARTQARDFYNVARIAFHDIQEDRIKLSEEARRSKRERVLRNICDYPYYFDFTNNLYKRLEASGRWIFDTAEYKAWLDFPKSSGLWYHAIPGFGKSVLTAGVVESLLDTSKSARIRHNVSYFFCAYTAATSLSARTIISSILHQLFYYSNNLSQDLMDDLESHFNDKNSSSRALLPDISRFIIRILNENKARNFIIIDGVDECNDKERGSVLRILKQVLTDTPENLKILISSRGSQDIARALKEFHQLDLSTSNQQDIELFIAQTLRDKELEGQLPEIPQDLFDKIKVFLAENAKGLFLWVDLQIIEICKEARAEDIEAALPGLPRDLDELYNRVLDRIRQQRRPEVARRIFRWMAYAMRPLTLDELKEAIAIDDPQSSSWASLQRQTEMDDAKWLQNCENLVVVNKYNKTVQFAHSTVKEFLESEQLEHSNFRLLHSDHKRLADACIKYFKLPEIIGQQGAYERMVSKDQVWNTRSLFTVEPRDTWTGWLARKAYEYATTPAMGSSMTSNSALVRKKSTARITLARSFKAVLQTYTFLEYASGNWLRHYCDFYRSPEPSAAACSGLKFLESEYLLDLTMQKYHSIRYPWQNYISPDSTTPREDIYNLLDWSLQEKVPFIFDVLDLDATLHPQPGRYTMMASVLSKFGSKDTIDKILMDYWFEADTSSDKAERNRFERIFCNLEAGVFPWTPPFNAILKSVASDLQQDGSQITKHPLYKDPSILCNLLYNACETGNVPFFTQWIDFVQVMPGVFRRNNPNAFPNGDFSITKHLDLATYERIVSGTIASGCLDIFHTLHRDAFAEFTRGLSIESRSKLLHQAVDSEKVEFFSLLMQYHGVAAHYDAGHQPSLAQKAILYGNADLFKICVRRDDHLTARSKTNRLYPIQIAAITNNMEIMNLIQPFLNKRNVDATAPGTSNTALTYAIKNHNLEMVQLLIDAGADSLIESNKPTLPEGVLTRPEKWNFPLLQFLDDPDPDIANILLQNPYLVSRLVKYMHPDFKLFEDPWTRFVQDAALEEEDLSFGSSDDSRTQTRNKIYQRVAPDLYVQ
ncbi:hypothetical protein TWF696_002541 [Orbilia brochopaga]